MPQLPEKYKENRSTFRAKAREVSGFGIFQVVVSLSIRRFLNQLALPTLALDCSRLYHWGKSAINMQYSLYILVLPVQQTESSPQTVAASRRNTTPTQDQLRTTRYNTRYPLF